MLLISPYQYRDLIDFFKRLLSILKSSFPITYLTMEHLVDSQVIYTSFIKIMNNATVRILVKISWCTVRVFLKLDYHRMFIFNFDRH